MAALKCQPFNFGLDVGFLTELGRRKLHEFGLSDAPVDVHGSFSRAERQDAASPMCVGADAFSGDTVGVPTSMSVAPGTLLNLNTMDDFKECDKVALLDRVANQIWEDIASGSALDHPEKLLRFVLLTFADLKSHTYIYWFAFPALTLSPTPLAEPPIPLSSLLDEAQIGALRQGVASLGTPHAPSAFAVRLAADGCVEVAPLRQWSAWQAAAAADGGQAWLAFCDPCPLQTNPGWPLRNLLALVSKLRLLPPGTEGEARPPIRVLCYREPPPGAAPAAAAPGCGSAGGGVAVRSIVLDVQVPPLDPAAPPPDPAAPRLDLLQVPPLNAVQVPPLDPEAPLLDPLQVPPLDPEAPLLDPLQVPPLDPEASRPKAVGWSVNSAGKPGPRMMDLSRQMKPEALAEASVDLNLRLMRWRLMPALNNEAVAGTRGLLIAS